MTTIDNTNILGIGNSCDCTSFVPTIAAVYAPTATVPNVIVTESSTIPAGDNYKRAVVTISDKYGNRVYGTVYNTGSGATFGTVTFTGSGPVLTAPVSAGGTLYCGGGNGKLQVTFTGGGGSGATGYATVVAGVITAVVITNGGTGYTTAPTAAVVIKSAVIPLTGLTLTQGVDINATVSTWGGAVTTGIKSCKSDVYYYNILTAATYTIGDDLGERDNETVNDTE